MVKTQKKKQQKKEIILVNKVPIEFQKKSEKFIKFMNDCMWFPKNYEFSFDEKGEIVNLTINTHKNKEPNVQFEEVLKELHSKFSSIYNLQLNIEELLEKQYIDQIQPLQNFEETLEILNLNIRSQNLDKKYFEKAIKYVCLSGLKQLTLYLEKNPINTGLCSLYTQMRQMENLVKVYVEARQISFDKKQINNLTKQIQQLSQLSSFHLNLSDNSLKQVEQLFEGFSKMSNLKHLGIDLKKNEINENEVKKISKHVAKYKFLESLFINLSYNKVYINGCDYLGEALQNLKDLTKFELRLDWDNVQDLGSSILGSHIRNMSGLIDLDIRLNYNKIFRQDFIQNQLIGLDSLIRLKIQISDKPPTKHFAQFQKILRNKEAEQLKILVFYRDLSSFLQYNSIFTLWDLYL
ncbi:hypothetical protein ABPG72_002044 [Tetrahymena utriculariae]